MPPPSSSSNQVNVTGPVLQQRGHLACGESMSEAGSHPESQSVLCSLQQGFFLEQHPPCVSWGYKEQIKCCASRRKTASFKICTRLKGTGRTWDVRRDGRRAGRSHPGAAELQPNQPSAEGAGKWGSSPAPGLSRGMHIGVPEGSADGSVFPAPCRVIPSNYLGVMPCWQ